LAIEIERKFLVSGEFKQLALKQFQITQAYLSFDKDRTVRIRIQDDEAFLTIKGSGNKSGISRFEWEKEIDLTEAELLIHLAIGEPVDKIRYLIPFQGHLFEVDVFKGNNHGLILAEIELKSEDESFSKPNWLGREVTGIARFFNSSLAQYPFNQWNEKEKI